MNNNKRLLLGAESDMLLAENEARGPALQPIVSVILVRTVIGYQPFPAQMVNEDGDLKVKGRYLKGNTIYIKIIIINIIHSLENFKQILFISGKIFYFQVELCSFYTPLSLLFY